MLELIKELVKRHWSFDYSNETLHLILGNKELFILTDDEANEILNEILMYW